MFNPNMTLEELFKPYSLRNIQTESRNSAMPHKGATYYITFSGYNPNSEVGNILEKGNKWFYSSNQGSICTYIDLSDKAHEVISSRLMQYGPNETSSRFHIEVNEYRDDYNRVRVMASGWGSSCIELYDGDRQALIDYLNQYQPRG